MHVDLSLWLRETGWRFAPHTAAPPPQLVLYFSDPGALEQGGLDELQSRYPAAVLVGCSTGGEIHAGEVVDNSISAAAISFDRASFAHATVNMAECASSHDAGLRLADGLPKAGLRAVFVLSDGTHVNGSDLVRALKQALPADTMLTGGLAGDRADFKATRVGIGPQPKEGNIVALGLYGDSLSLRHGSFSGWDPFGPERMVTRSDHNILYELDGEPALDLYKRYLGDQARNLPGAALLFPLKIRSLDDSRTDLVRTVVGIDEANKAMIFAGDIPTGAPAQMMRGVFTHLIDAAGEAARQAMGDGSGSLAILISCIGRKLLLGQRVAEEVDSVAAVLGPKCQTIGFYSYGEISPHQFTGSCELHNQTMTITVIGED